MITENQIINAQIKSAGMSEEEFFALEISAWQGSSQRETMILGKNYYEGEHEILKRSRTAIGKNGQVEEVENLPNNIVIDNRYARLVDQKKNYLVGKPITVKCNDEEYYKALMQIFDTNFARMIKLVGEDAIIGGISWVYPYVDDFGNMRFKAFPSYEILPFWKDSAHTELDCAVRVYTTEQYVRNEKTTVTMVEVYKLTGVTTYEYTENQLVKVMNEKAYLNYNGQDYNWKTLPIIPFKSNAKEVPLIKRVRQLQDALNLMLSDFVNNMEENVRNSILVLKNYDGTDLGEFRKNLAVYGAIKTRTQEGSSGGVDVLRVEVDANNYSVITQMLIRAITQNARGFEARDEKIGASNPNQLNIRSMYSDIDLDANDMETEFQASFSSILEFINIYLQAFSGFDASDKETEFIFNRDILINESEAIENCVKSKDILSKETIIAQHPWVKNIKQEFENTTW